VRGRHEVFTRERLAPKIAKMGNARRIEEVRCGGPGANAPDEQGGRERRYSQR
jgi:hypothetical protein